MSSLIVAVLFLFLTAFFLSFTYPKDRVYKKLQDALIFGLMGVLLILIASIVQWFI
jgi:hypothetical protein